jgi:DNA-binding CsgD family transcriptional regulator
MSVLTPREYEVAEALATRTEPLRELCKVVGMSHKNLKSNYAQLIYRKLYLRGRADLMMHWRWPIFRMGAR